MYTLYTAEKELLTLHQNNESNLPKLQYWPHEVFHKLETRIHLLIQLTPILQFELEKKEQIPNSCGKLVRKHSIRRTYYHPSPSLMITNLTTQQIALYQLFWTLTHLLSTQDNKLFFQHYIKPLSPLATAPACGRGFILGWSAQQYKEEQRTTMDDQRDT